MATDFEDRLAFILKRTLYFWLFPYIIWFFGRRLYRRIVHWMTEPVAENHSQNQRDG